MRDGRIVQSGQYQELLESGLDFESLVKSHTQTLEKVDDLNDSSWEEFPGAKGFHEGHLSTPLSSSCESLSASYLPPSLEPSNAAPELPRPSSQLLMSPLFVAPVCNNVEASEGNALKLIEDEERATGCVSRGVYRLYLTTAYGGSVALFLVFSQVR